jgi:hypothetical protein
MGEVTGVSCGGSSISNVQDMGHPIRHLLSLSEAQYDARRTSKMELSQYLVQNFPRLRVKTSCQDG